MICLKLLDHDGGLRCIPWNMVRSISCNTGSCSITYHSICNGDALVEYQRLKEELHQAQPLQYRLCPEYPEDHKCDPIYALDAARASQALRTFKETNGCSDVAFTQTFKAGSPNYSIIRQAISNRY